MLTFPSDAPELRSWLRLTPEVSTWQPLADAAAQNGVPEDYLRDLALAGLIESRAEGKRIYVRPIILAAHRRVRL